jgi:hypothetical protein
MEACLALDMVEVIHKKAEEVPGPRWPGNRFQRAALLTKSEAIQTIVALLSTC